MTGTSAMRIFCSEALITISLANSMPVAWSRSLSYASLRKPRSPQCMSLTGVWKKSLLMKVRTGLPTQWCDQTMAPAWMPPANRLPMTRS